MRMLDDTVDTLAAIRPPHGGHILVLDSDEGLARTIAGILRHDGYTVTTVTSIYDAVLHLHEGPADLLLVELTTEGMGSDDILTRARELAPSAVVIVLTRYATYDSALHALRAGAYDFLVKPLDVETLRVTVARGMEHHWLQQELATRLRELETAHAQVRDFNEVLQQQVEDATAKLCRKVDELDSANAQLRRTQEEQNTFVAMVAHEMRGPLNPIINYAQLAKRPNITPDQLDHYSDTIVEHAFRLNRLVDDLQTATRLSTGHFSLQRERRDISAAVREVVDHFISTVRDRRFVLELPAEPLYAEVDTDRVIQAVRNLLDNAVKYSADGGAVEVSVWNDPSNAFIRVRDYGAGIPEEEMNRIFEAFTRLEKRVEVVGSGLGLYITRGIVAAHGGELLVSNGAGSERARGAIFTIVLPLSAPATPLEVESPPTPPLGA